MNMYKTVPLNTPNMHIMLGKYNKAIENESAMEVMGTVVKDLFGGQAELCYLEDDSGVAVVFEDTTSRLFYILLHGNIEIKVAQETAHIMILNLYNKFSNV